MEKEKNNYFHEKLIKKASLKKLVYKNTSEVFLDFKKVADQLCLETRKVLSKQNAKIRVDFKDKSEFEGEIIFAGDTLIMAMHSNVFEFPRLHNVMKTPYIIDDPSRSYSGIINIYNFLSDSFKYNRLNDEGYLVARIFINKEKHFLVEGKHQTGFYFDQFMNHPIDHDSIKKILESAISYSIDFDLLTPPYDLVKETNVSEVLENSLFMKQKTGKRLGFRFQSDHDKLKTNK
ncbi:MAG: hypothetical protein ACOCWC_05195 [Bacteroidota bacterium]